MKITKKLYIPLIFLALINTGGSNNTLSFPNPASKQITIQAHAFSRKESKKHFGLNLLKRGYRPIELIIRNDSDHAYLLKPDNISIPVEKETKNIRKATRKSPLKTAKLWFSGSFLGLTAVGLTLLFSSITLSDVITYPIFMIFLAIGTAEVIAGAFVISSFTTLVATSISTIKSKKRKKQLTKRVFSRKKEGIVIPEHTELKTIFFVPFNEYHPDFSITLEDGKTGEPLTMNLASS